MSEADTYRSDRDRQSLAYYNAIMTAIECVNESEAAPKLDAIISALISVQGQAVNTAPAGQAREALRKAMIQGLAEKHTRDMPPMGATVVRAIKE